jgi:hypothetical protein
MTRGSLHVLYHEVIRAVEVESICEEEIRALRHRLALIRKECQEVLFAPVAGVRPIDEIIAG